MGVIKREPQSMYDAREVTLPVTQAFELWVEQQKVAPWLAAAAKALRGWGEGQQITESDFTNAVRKAADVRLG